MQTMSIPVTTKRGETMEERRRAHATAADRYRAASSPDWAQREREAAVALRKSLTEHYAPHDEKIAAALKAVNGRAESFTITTAAVVRNVARDAEDILATRGVTQKNRIGATVVYEPDGPSAKRYKYTAASTRLHLRRAADGWRLMGVERTEVRPKDGETLRIEVSAAAGRDIIDHATRGITIRQEEATS